jgi:hypothetical protein
LGLVVVQQEKTSRQGHAGNCGPVRAGNESPMTARGQRLSDR